MQGLCNVNFPSVSIYKSVITVSAFLILLPFEIVVYMHTLCPGYESSPGFDHILGCDVCTEHGETWFFISLPEPHQPKKKIAVGPLLSPFPTPPTVLCELQMSRFSIPQTNLVLWLDIGLHLKAKVFTPG